MKAKVLSILALLLMAATGVWAQVVETQIYTYSPEGSYPFYFDGASTSGATATVTDGILNLYNPQVQKDTDGNPQAYMVQPQIGSGFATIKGFSYRIKIEYKTTVEGSVNVVLYKSDWSVYEPAWGLPITISNDYQTLEVYMENISYDDSSENFIVLQFGHLVGTVSIKKVEVYKIATVNVTANEGATGEYWATYYNATQGYTADANTTVYKAAVNGSSVELTEVTDIHANSAVILKSTAATITLTPAATTSSDFTGNQLKGGTTVESGYDAYTLSRGDGSGAVGFYKFSGSLDGSKAHLEIPSAAGARGFYGFGDSETTAIEAPTATVGIDDGETFDLTGRRIEGQPTRKGIYVRNGQKFIVK